MSNIIATTETRSSVFALLIGIDNYKGTFQGLRPLQGAVADVLAFKEYLVDVIHVPNNDKHIKSLTNEEATHSNIIGSLERLREDPNIKEGDAILLYYAGHGAELSPTQGLSTQDEPIQCIVPHDCDVVDQEGRRVLPIPDHTLENLLSDIANAKGDNITVVFDCCHSASGTRGGDEEGVVERSVELPSDRGYFEKLNQERPGDRGTRTLEQHKNRGVRSHVLLCACGKQETAREKNGHGNFTTSLLGLLRQVSVETLRYSEILQHPKFIPIPQQKPQCEGFNKERIMFDGKVHPPQWKSFRITRKGDGSEYIVHGGEINNVTVDSEFTVFRKTDTGLHTALGTLIVSKVYLTSLEAKLSSGSGEFKPEETIAIQTKFGEQQRLRLRISPENGFSAKFNDILVKQPESKNRFDNIVTIVNDAKDADVEIAFADASQDKLKFTVYHHLMYPPDFKPILAHQKEHVIGLADHAGLVKILSNMAHFYREVKHSAIDNSIDVDVEFYELEDDGKRMKLGPEPKNLHADGKVDLVVPDISGSNNPPQVLYGLRLINKTSDLGLYANIYTFNAHDLSICSLIVSEIGTTSTAVDIPLRPKSNLDIGFGTYWSHAPIALSREDTLDIEVGFIKIYLSTETANISYLDQVSPFDEPTPDEATRGAKPYIRKEIKKMAWAIKTIPLILRRHAEEK